jgi:hypothetical protein
MRVINRSKVEYGDFQTPLELAETVCQQLINLGINPDIIIEPTCGIGNFIETAAYLFPSASKIVGFEINQHYLEQFRQKQLYLQNQKIELKHINFFEFDWSSYLDGLDGEILVLGNFPWVTNSQQGNIDSHNLPQKSNFQNHKGLDAIMGKSNFDISEWMLIQSIHSLQNRGGNLAMLCKTSVARKILSYIYSQNLTLASFATYKIDAKKYFDATVDACLLVCRFDRTSRNYFCDVFDTLGSLDSHRIGYRHNILIRDIDTFDRLSNLYDLKTGEKWRSGVKHDYSSVMEFRKIDGIFVNGLGESVDIEETYLFPLLKGSDIAQNRIQTTNRYVLVPQRFVGESTDPIERLAPNTWAYLESHEPLLNSRKSKIYLNNPRFSIFGVGTYTFRPWKIAICGLYKKLAFRLIGNLDDKPTIFDDTVYFLSFDSEEAALATFTLLTSQSATDFYSSSIFWDEKRPIKSSILNSLNLTTLAEFRSIDSPILSF